MTFLLSSCVCYRIKLHLFIFPKFDIHVY